MEYFGAMNGHHKMNLNILLLRFILIICVPAVVSQAENDSREEQGGNTADLNIFVETFITYLQSSDVFSDEEKQNVRNIADVMKYVLAPPKGKASRRRMEMFNVAFLTAIAEVVVFDGDEHVDEDIVAQKTSVIAKALAFAYRNAFGSSNLAFINEIGTLIKIFVQAEDDVEDKFNAPEAGTTDPREISSRTSEFSDNLPPPITSIPDTSSKVSASNEDISIPENDSSNHISTSSQSFVADFQKYLYYDLLSSSMFRSAFSGSFSQQEVNVLAIAMIESLITEPIFGDLDKEVLLIAFESALNESNRSLQDYAFIFVTEISQILKQAGLLTEDNASDLSMDIALFMIEGLRNKLDELAVQHLNNSTSQKFQKNYFTRQVNWSGINVSDDLQNQSPDNSYFYPSWLESNLTGSSEQIYDYNVMYSSSDLPPIDVVRKKLNEDSADLEPTIDDYFGLKNQVSFFTICLYEEFMSSTHFQTICFIEVRNGMMEFLVQSLANGLASTVLLNYTDTFEVHRFLNNSLQSLEQEFTLDEFARAVAISFAEILNQYGVIGQNWSCQQATWLALLLIESLSTSWYQQGRDMVYLNSHISSNNGPDAVYSPLPNAYQNSNSLYTSINQPSGKKTHTVGDLHHLHNIYYSDHMTMFQPLHTFYVQLFYFLVESEIFRSEFPTGAPTETEKDSISAIVKSLSLSPEFSWIGDDTLFSAIIDAVDFFHPRTTEKYADVIAILITQAVAEVRLVNSHNAHYRASLVATLIFTGLTIKQKSNSSLNLKLKQSFPGSNSVGTREKIVEFIQELTFLSDDLSATRKSENSIKEENSKSSVDFHLNTSSTPSYYSKEVTLNVFSDAFNETTSETEATSSAIALEPENNTAFSIANVSNFSNESKNTSLFVNQTATTSDFASAVATAGEISVTYESFPSSLAGTLLANPIFPPLPSSNHMEPKQKASNTSQVQLLKAINASVPDVYTIYTRVNNSNELQNSEFRRGNHNGKENDFNETSFPNALSEILPIQSLNRPDMTSTTAWPKSVTEARDELKPLSENDTRVHFPQELQTMLGTMIQHENAKNNTQNSVLVNSSVLQIANFTLNETPIKYIANTSRGTLNQTSVENYDNVNVTESIDTSMETLEMRRGNSRTLFQETFSRNVLSSDIFNYVVGSGIAKSSSFHIADAITKALFGATKSKSTAAFKLRLMKAFLSAPPSGDTAECAKELASAMGNFYDTQNILDPSNAKEQAAFLANTILAVVRKWDNRLHDSDKKYDVFQTYYRQNTQDDNMKVENAPKEANVNETAAREKMLASIFETLLYHNLLLCQPFTAIFTPAAKMPTGEEVSIMVAESIRDIPGVNSRIVTNRFELDLLNSLRRDTPKTAKEYAHILSDLTTHILSNNSLISSTNTFPLATIVANKICYKLSHSRNKKTNISNSKDQENRTFSNSKETKERKVIDLLNSEKEKLSKLNSNNTEENKKVLAETLNTLASVIHGQNLTFDSEEMLLKALTESLLEAVHVILEHNQVNANILN